ncbi:protoheme IX farnesyltransferase [Hymenobacter busanensis]|uniref:Protoheme IX farnesyltransferase n=1 Tax=Hymenobacter busanensis TaxID=2607656 RepID=A0A7L5A0L0_9BACT|nr:heme o synthase [Hymenobacter busanensis]KAA9338262.1 protoheme IX farnesyltransferase [Hymenobacter busanensis]QHJ09314.1 protoheme IX farnesyltransferase [Hymenobacter busanensis]
MTKVRAYFQLLKFRLSLTVSFSAAIGYMLGQHEFSWKIHWVGALLVMLGGMLVTGAANTINQIYEKDLDKLMKRTAKRPMPKGVLSVAEGWVFVGLTGIAGLALLGLYFNPLTAALSLISLILYGFIYTPLKTISPICVAVGAIPGALPPMIGWVAATNTLTGELGMGAWILFGIQFMWQFPHFWAIAWVLDEDYRKAGFRMLPAPGGRDLRTAFQIMTYTLLLIPLSLLPMQFGMTGKTSALIAVVCGVLFLMQTLYLMRTCTKKAAMRIMFGSFLYLPIVQIALVFDKI